MTIRMIPRREVLAFIALTTDEASAPHRISFREYHDANGEAWHVVDLDVDSDAAVRFWAGVFGHREFSYTSSDHTRDDGSRWTSYNSQDTGWRGWTTEVHASVDAPPADVPLDDATRDQLREIAGVTS